MNKSTHISIKNRDFLNTARKHNWTHGQAYFVFMTEERRSAKTPTWADLRPRERDYYTMLALVGDPGFKRVLKPIIKGIYYERNKALRELRKARSRGKTIGVSGKSA